MVVACMLICCEAGKFRDVASGLGEIQGVKQAFSTHGRWDVVVEVEAADVEALGEISVKVHSLPGVRATETLIGF
ncbi:MAG: Lrp/AsnC ligand binding domain-containing protein [Candidatus Bathyarchaeia archaeon]